MLAPSQQLRPIPPVAAKSSRAVSLGLMILLHIVVIYAFAAGLAHQMIEMLPQNVEVNIIPPHEKTEPPPPPPPTFKQPPPFVPPPDVTVDLSAPATSAISAQTTQKGITAPASVGATHSCQNQYPPLSSKLNEKGTTEISMRILTDGTVADVQVIKSSGYSRLDEAAVSCASHWHYNPAKQNGQAIEMTWKSNVVWKLR